MHYWRGISEAVRAKYQDAIAQFDDVITYDPDDAQAFYWRGMCRGKLKEYERAIGRFR